MHKTINGWTKAKMISRVKKLFKGKAVLATGACVYKTDDGKRCAVGLFIPSNRPAAFKVAGSVCTLLSNHPSLKKVMPLEEDALSEFQKFHDHQLAYSWSNELQKTELIKWIERNVE